MNERRRGTRLFSVSFSQTHRQIHAHTHTHTHTVFLTGLGLVQRRIARIPSYDVMHRCAGAKSTVNLPDDVVVKLWTREYGKVKFRLWDLT
jgi:hypothetical protein